MDLAKQSLSLKSTADQLSRLVMLQMEELRKLRLQNDTFLRKGAAMTTQGVNVSLVKIGSGWTQVLGVNSKRKAIILGANDAGTVYYSFSQSFPTATAGGPTGIAVSTGSSIPILCRDEIGSVVQQPLYAWDGGVNSQVCITEIVETEFPGSNLGN
jgi:hypothetical protein